MSSTLQLGAQPTGQSGIATLATLTTLGALTESIANEINESLSGIIINASACLRMLAADALNVEAARQTARRTIRDGNRAAKAIAQFRTHLREADTSAVPIVSSLPKYSDPISEGA